LAVPDVNAVQSSMAFHVDELAGLAAALTMVLSVFGAASSIIR
jgi:hypothetical protein